MNNEKQHKEIIEKLTRTNDNLEAIFDLIFHRVIEELQDIAEKVKKLEG